MDEQQQNKTRTKELAILKAKAHNVYNRCREMDLSHAIAMAAAIETVYDAMLNILEDLPIDDREETKGNK